MRIKKTLYQIPLFLIDDFCCFYCSWKWKCKNKNSFLLEELCWLTYCVKGLFYEASYLPIITWVTLTIFIVYIHNLLQNINSEMLSRCWRERKRAVVCLMAGEEEGCCLLDGWRGRGLLPAWWMERKRVIDFLFLSSVAAVLLLSLQYTAAAVLWDSNTKQKHMEQEKQNKFKHMEQVLLSDTRMLIGRLEWENWGVTNWALSLDQWVQGSNSDARLISKGCVEPLK